MTGKSRKPADILVRASNRPAEQSRIYEGDQGKGTATVGLRKPPSHAQCSARLYTHAGLCAYLGETGKDLSYLHVPGGM